MMISILLKLFKIKIRCAEEGMQVNKNNGIERVGNEKYEKISMNDKNNEFLENDEITLKNIIKRTFKEIYKFCQFHENWAKNLFLQIFIGSILLFCFTTFMAIAIYELLYKD